MGSLLHACNSNQTLFSCLAEEYGKNATPNVTCVTDKLHWLANTATVGSVVGLMSTILKEERYLLYLNGNEHFLRVQELISGTEIWPERFRVQLAASSERESARFYGSTALEVVLRASSYLSSSPSDIITGRSVISRTVD